MVHNAFALKNWLWLLLAAGAVALIMNNAQAALGGTTVSVVEQTYKISGNTAQHLKDQMQRLGPHGFWAFTDWTVEWSNTCKIDVRIAYTFPALADRNAVPLILRKRWDAMIYHLRQHEQGHGQHARNAAREMALNQCRNARKIIAKWSRQDKVYDTQTRHGETQGVVLGD